MLSGRAIREVQYVYHSLFKDIERWNDVDLSKSEQQFFRRLESEGFSFVTSQLPLLGKALDSVLVGNLWQRPPNFGPKSSSDTRPELFNELFSLVLDENGVELKEPSVTAVKDIRQIAGLFYKYELPPDDTTIEAAWVNLVEVDKTLTRPRIQGDIAKILNLARILLTELLCKTDPKTGIPGHGPGAVVENLENWEKSLFHEVPTDKALKYFGFEYFLHTPKDAERSMSRHGQRLHAGNQVKPVSKFGCVPKDSRGPRVVCKEATVTQWLQQGIKKLLYELIENHPLTKGKVNFTDQSINGRLALWGSSMERDIVTLDMKEASDRVTDWLVEEIFPANWYDAFYATRSVFISNGPKKYGPIKKFAPMGSALCFPVESLVHWSIAVSSITLVNGLDLDEVLENVYVYGDDIVIRGLPYRSLFKVFSYLGMRFNESKCCTEGRFRESCGVDAYRGELVNPLRIKKPILSSELPETLVAAIEYSNIAYNFGLHSLSKALETICRNNWYRDIPYVTADSDVPGFSGERGNGPFRSLLCSDLRYLRYDSKSQIIKYRARGVKGKAFTGNTDWCRYRDTLRSLAERPAVKDPKNYFRYPLMAALYTTVNPVVKPIAPVYRHALFVTKKYSASVVCLPV